MSDAVRKLTVRDLRKLCQQGERLVVLTAYDALFARLVDESGAHLVLVGDSLGMTCLGYRNTIQVTLEQSLHHTAAVVRGVKRALVIGDMPFMTFQISEAEALRNAARYLQEAGADGVKLEGGRAVAPTVKRLVDSGIPVLGHIGILPQKVVGEGYRIVGRTPAEARGLLEDARALEAAGAFGIVLEGIPRKLAKKITASIGIPTIGIGAGPDCSGQVQVVHDILGLFEDFVPKHTKRYGDLAQTIRGILAQYGEDVRSGQFPGDEQSFS
jgi:3-methyl-2-oxobutanoate hydroxymethyltransferase